MTAWRIEVDAVANEMLMGALMGGMVLQKGGLAMPLPDLYRADGAAANPLGELHFHHGTLIGILLPHVIAFNSVVAGERLAEIGAALDWLACRQQSAGYATASPMDRPDLVRRPGAAEHALARPAWGSSVHGGSADIAAKAEKGLSLSATNPRVPAMRGDYDILDEIALESFLCRLARLKERTGQRNPRMDADLAKSIVDGGLTWAAPAFPRAPKRFWSPHRHQVVIVGAAAAIDKFSGYPRPEPDATDRRTWRRWGDTAGQSPARWSIHSPHSLAQSMMPDAAHGTTSCPTSPS